MSELRPAVVILYMKDRPRVLIFEDHNDAVDTAKAFGNHGIGWVMVSPEHYAQGEKPEDTPPMPKKLFNEE